MIIRMFANREGIPTGCFRDESPCSVCMLFTPVLGSGRADRSGGPRVGWGMVTGSGFAGSHVTPPSWVTSGPQFAMKLVSDAAKLDRIVSAIAVLLWRPAFTFS